MKYLFTFTLLLVLLVPQFVWSAPKSDLWPRWQAHNPESLKIIDHTSWQNFLDKYLQINEVNPDNSDVSGVNLVRYGNVTESDQKILKMYLKSLQKINISNFSRKEQRAFWINLYNAETVFLILENFPLESITKISFSFFSFGPWDEELLVVEGEELSLNDIEHRILRPIWKDARIHYALNCASIGCPNLQAVAFTAKNTESFLEQGAVEYINHPRGAKLSGNELMLSKIYEWYQEDFGGNEQGVLRHLRKYAKENLAKSLSAGEPEIAYQYDWRLNGLAPGSGSDSPIMASQKLTPENLHEADQPNPALHLVPVM